MANRNHIPFYKIHFLWRFLSFFYIVSRVNLETKINNNFKYQIAN